MMNIINNAIRAFTAALAKIISPLQYSTYRIDNSQVFLLQH